MTYVCRPIVQRAGTGGTHRAVLIRVIQVEITMRQIVAERHRSTPQPQVLNLNELVDRCLGNIEFAERLLRRFGDLLDADVEVIAQAAGANDIHLVCQIAHRIKGASANVAAPALVKVAEEIEAAAKDADFETIWSRLPVLAAERDRFQQSTPQFDRSDIAAN